MKKQIPCLRCANCVVVLPAGFMSTERFSCMLFGHEIEPDDGCTFGAEGHPVRGTYDWDVSIEGQAAVCGFDEDW